MIETTTWIAVYGAMVSTLIVLWNVWVWHSDKPSIKVTSSGGFTKIGNDVSDTQIIFTASNVGKRPVTLTSFGLRLNDNNDLISMDVKDNLPHRLEEGESHYVYYNLDDLKSRLSGKIPKSVWFRDATGKLYKSKWKLNKLIT